LYDVENMSYLPEKISSFSGSLTGVLPGGRILGSF
jgi:hypothetical protein